MAFGDRKTPLKRTEFKRKEPVNTDRKQRAPLRQRSKKRAAHMRTSRIPMIEEMVAEGRTCEVCPALAAIGVTTHCAGIQGLHERRKAGAAGSRELHRNLVPACNWSNTFIEDNPELVRLHFGTRFIVREGDPEWHELSMREDRLG